MKTETLQNQTIVAFHVGRGGKYAESELQDSVIEALASIFNGDEIKVEEEEEINLY
jgi:hypothetical protein